MLQGYLKVWATFVISLSRLFERFGHCTCPLRTTTPPTVLFGAFTLVMKYGEMYLVGEMRDTGKINMDLEIDAFEKESSLGLIFRFHGKLPGCTYHSYKWQVDFDQTKIWKPKLAPHCSPKRLKNGEIPRFFISMFFFWPKFSISFVNSELCRLEPAELKNENWHLKRAYRGPKLGDSAVSSANLVSKTPRVWHI